MSRKIKYTLELTVDGDLTNEEIRQEVYNFFRGGLYVYNEADEECSIEMENPWDENNIIDLTNERSKHLPQPDCHFYDQEHDTWVWAYSQKLLFSLL